jgi:hypothetical protein
MRIHLLFLLALFLASSATFAQKISGTIRTHDGEVAQYATVLLYQAADTVMAKGALTDEAGHYEFENISSGQYFIQSKLIGNGAGAGPVFDYAGGDKILGDIELGAVSNELKGVTITASKPMIEVRADKTVLNVEGNINSQGQNALELLRKAPGVTVDNNDNINLRGKNSVRIQIDGRDVPMQSSEVAALLKNMRAEEIAAIEMISNPSAKYDASGNAGIINIKTRKNKGLGSNGSLGTELIQGETFKWGVNGAGNFRNEKVNVFGNYNNHFADWHNDISLLRDQNDIRFDQTTLMTDNNNRHGFKLGTDFFLNDKHTIGFLVDGRHNKGPWSNTSKTYISSLETPDIMDSVLIASNHVPQERNNFNFNLNYRYADTTGRELSIDANRGIYRYRANSLQSNYYMDPTEQVVLNERIYRNNTPTDVDMFIGKIDYEQPLWKGKLGIGYKTTNVKTDNVFDYFNVLNGESIKSLERSNHFVYDEHVNAGYVNYNAKFGKLGVQAGVRAEHTNYVGDLISELPDMNEQISNKYLSWFPSGALTYEMNKKNQFSLTYSRRIDRPRYQDLNPFEDRLDELTYKKGNPFLRPQFTNSVELTHTFMGFVNTTIGYSKTNDMFTEYIDTTETTRSFLRQANIASQTSYSLSLGVPMPIAKWWEGYLSWTGYITAFDAEFRPGFAYEEQFKAFNLYSEQTFKLPKGWSVQLSGWFNSPAIWQAVFRSKPQGAMDFGIKKQLFDGDGTVSLSFGDILGTAGWSSVNDFTPGLYMLGSGHWESQTIRLNMNYRFGNKNIKNARRRSTGLEDINKRLGGGN